MWYNKVEAGEGIAGRDDLHWRLSPCTQPFQGSNKEFNTDFRVSFNRHSDIRF
jgi:hypothetical protein